MAMRTKEIFLLSVPVAGAAAMVARLPPLELLGVALAAQAVGFLEWKQPPVGKVKHVTVLRVMAVKAPTVLLVMLEINRVVKIHFPRCAVHFIIREVAIGTREDAFRKWRRCHRNEYVVVRGSLSFRRFRKLEGAGNGGRYQDQTKCGEAGVVMLHGFCLIN